MSRGVVTSLLLGACFCGVGSGCQFQWDTLGSELPLVGEPLSLATLQKINAQPTEGALVFTDRQDRAYAAFSQPTAVDPMHPMGETVSVVALDDDAPPVSLYGKDVIPGSHVLYVQSILDPATNEEPVTLRVHPFDRAELATTLLLPAPSHEPLALVPSWHDEALLYFSFRPDATTFDLYRTDGSVHQQIPFPDAITPTEPFETGQYLFSSQSDWLLVRDSNSDVVLHDTRGVLAPKRFGAMSGALWADDERAQVFGCGFPGLVGRSYDGAVEHVLDARPCNPTRTSVWLTPTWIYYTVDEGARVTLARTRRDGTTAPEMVDPNPRRILDIVTNNDGVERCLFSSEPDELYVNDSSDGWIGSWRFMERGRLPRLTRDGSRVFWLEHAAQGSNAGELLMANVPGGAPVRLAYNATQVDLLADGRVVATANAAFTGVHNRVVILDPERGEQRRLVDAAPRFTLLPNREELLVEVFANAGSSLLDVYRVPIPAR